MGAFKAGGQRVLLIRNHEVQRLARRLHRRPAPVYDSAAPGGDTYVLVDLEGNVSAPGRPWPAPR